jgi:hypothetical protein
MKKLLTACFLFFLLSESSAQNAVNLVIRANYVRVYSKPDLRASIPNEYFKNGEKVLLIKSLIEVTNPHDASTYFARVYRNGNNQMPYYMNTSEIGSDIYSGLILPANDAVVEERTLENLWLPLDNNVLNIGDVFFIPYNQCVYSFLDRASYSNSSREDKDYSGFYKINEIISCKIHGNTRVLLSCSPMNTAFNANKEQKVYVDFYKNKNALSFINLKLGGEFFNLMNSFMTAFPNASTTPDQFYSYFLTYLFGKETFQSKDEFEKHRILTSGKEMMDSIYKSCSQLFDTPLSTVFISQLSDYDFNTKSFNIEALTPSGGLYDNFNHHLYPIQMFFETIHTASVFDGLNTDVADNFINLSQFKPQLAINEDAAEGLINELRTNIINENSGRDVVLVFHFKYLSQNQLKDFYNKYKVLNRDEINFPKLIESIDVYSTKGFTKDQLSTSDALTVSARNEMHKLSTLYPNGNSTDESKVDENQIGIDRVDFEAQFPGGDAGWSRYIGRVLQSQNGFSQSDYGTCTVKFIVDKEGNVSDVQATTMKGTKLAEAIVNAVIKGPRWTPAQSNGRYVNSYRIVHVTLPQ